MIVFILLVISADGALVGLGRTGGGCTNLALRVIVAAGTKREDVTLDVVARIRVPAAHAVIRDRVVRISARGRRMISEGALALVVLPRMDGRDGGRRHVGHRSVDGRAARGGGRRGVVENSAEGHGGAGGDEDEDEAAKDVAADVARGSGTGRTTSGTSFFGEGAAGDGGRAGAVAVGRTREGDGGKCAGISFCWI